MDPTIDLARGPKPQNYLILAIFSTLCCCLPTGIAAIVYAAQVDGRWAGGDVAGAAQSAEKARMWSIVSIVLGVLSLGVYAGGVMMGAIEP